VSLGQPQLSFSLLTLKQPWLSLGERAQKTASTWIQIEFFKQQDRPIAQLKLDRRPVLIFLLQ